MDPITSGPVDIVFVRFDGNRFNGRILLSLSELVERQLIRVLDVLVVSRSADGAVAVRQGHQLARELGPACSDLLRAAPGGWLDAEDARDTAPAVAPGSALAMLAIENLWEAPFVDAVHEAGGDLVDQARVGGELVASMRARG